MQRVAPWNSDEPWQVRYVDLVVEDKKERACATVQAVKTALPTLPTPVSPGNLCRSHTALFLGVGSDPGPGRA